MQCIINPIIHCYNDHFTCMYFKEVGEERKVSMSKEFLVLAFLFIICGIESPSGDFFSS